jgi:hypothetical protein
VTIFLPSNVIILSSCGLVTGKPALSFGTGGPMKFIGMSQILLGRITLQATVAMVEPWPLLDVSMRQAASPERESVN